MNESFIRTFFGIPRDSLVSNLRRLADELESVDRGDCSIRPSVEIRDWALGSRTVPCLVGRSTDHPCIGNDQPMFSSQLFFLDSQRGIARTYSRWYRLGNKADPQYWDETYLDN